MEPLPPPVQLGEITEEELKQYDGSDSKSPFSWPSKARSMLFKAENFCLTAVIWRCGKCLDSQGDLNEIGYKARLHYGNKDNNTQGLTIPAKKSEASLP
ncbi:hypothetical protein DY000_02060897 [Brassica cretica]|uniref:Uncharacterized protein n=1 Tax=Brassica cretica TaxID=69181 RepID=A0ABQ7AWG6_BRACR|nr:hypothetical protein DY000_02060897 [Brassica cretica]